MKPEDLRLYNKYINLPETEHYDEKEWELVYIDKKNDHFYFFKKGDEDGTIQKHWILYEKPEILKKYNINYIYENNNISFENGGVFLYLTSEQIMCSNMKPILKDKIKNILNR